MKKIFQFFTRKKDTTPPLFQIRRHIFEYSPKQEKKRKKKYFFGVGMFRSLSMLHFDLAGLRVFLIILMISLLSAGVILSFQLSIREIYITRESSLIDVNEAYRNLEYLRGRSIINLQKDNIKTRLQSSQSVIQDIYVKRKFPSTVEVHIVPYTPLFQSSEGLIMSSGNIFPLMSEKKDDIPWLDIVGYESSLLSTGPDFSVSDLSNILLLREELEKNILGFRVGEKKYYIREREIHIRDSAGTIYLFDLTHSIMLQTEKLAIYFREKQKNPGERDMTYIDVRVPRGLFICPLTEERICMRNLENIYGENTGIFTLTALGGENEETTPEE